MNVQGYQRYLNRLIVKSTAFSKPFQLWTTTGLANDTNTPYDC
jgi:hypothetical protein